MSRSPTYAADARYRLLISLSLIVATLCGVSTTASAAGFFLPGRGVKPMGRAGAYIASGGQDLNSLWYNPANLAGLETTTLTLDLSLVNLNFDFTRAPRTLDNGEVKRYETVSNEAPPKANPQILIGGPLSKEMGLAWAFGVYAPYLSGHTFPEDGPQRYVLVDNDASALLYTHLALAWQLGDRVRLGAGLQNVWANFVLVNVTSAYTGLYGEAEDEDLDLLTRITMASLFNPSANLGAWFKISSALEVAFSLQLPVVIRDDEAKLETRLPDNALFANAELEGDTISGQLTFPLMARLGLRLVLDGFDHEVAVVYENWAALEAIDATPNNVSVTGVPGLGSINVAPLSVPLNYRDTVSIRNGSNIKLTSALDLRLGYTFETSAIPDEYYSVFLADATKHMFALGGSYAFESFSIDSSFSYFVMPDRVITTSKVRQINPTDTENENTLIVGNGEYQQAYMIFGVGVNKRF